MTPELGRIILAQICLHACMAGTRMAAPLLALHQGYSPVAVGVLLALFALTQVFLALPAGRYADRHGIRRPLIFSMVASMTGAGAAMAFPVFPVLCFAALMTGGATGAAVIALQRHVGRAANGALQLKQVFSWLSIGPAVSNFIGPFSAGMLIDHVGAGSGSELGYRAAFLMMAILPLASWWLLQRVRELPPIVVAPGSPPPKTWDLLGDVTFRRLMLVNWFLSSCWDVHTFVAFAIAAAAVRIILPLVANRLREWAVLCTAMLITGLLFGVYPFMTSAVGMGVCSVVLGLTLGMVQPMVMSMLHQITPETRHGEALGLRLMANNASSVIMPLLFGTTGAFIGIAGVFWMTGTVVGAGSRFAWLLKDSLPSSPHSSHGSQEP